MSKVNIISKELEQRICYQFNDSEDIKAVLTDMTQYMLINNLTQEEVDKLLAKILVQLLTMSYRYTPNVHIKDKVNELSRFVRAKVSYFMMDILAMEDLSNKKLYVASVKGDAKFLLTKNHTQKEIDYKFNDILATVNEVHYATLFDVLHQEVETKEIDQSRYQIREVANHVPMNVIQPILSQVAKIQAEVKWQSQFNVRGGQSRDVSKINTQLKTALTLEQKVIEYFTEGMVQYLLPREIQVNQAGALILYAMDIKQSLIQGRMVLRQIDIFVNLGWVNIYQITKEIADCMTISTFFKG